MNVCRALPCVISITCQASQDSSFLLTKFASASAFVGRISAGGESFSERSITGSVPHGERLQHADEGRSNPPCDSHAVDWSHDRDPIVRHPAAVISAGLPTHRHCLCCLHRHSPFLPTICAYLVHGERLACNKPRGHRNDHPGCIRNRNGLPIRGISSAGETTRTDGPRPKIPP